MSTNRPPQNLTRRTPPLTDTTGECKNGPKAGAFTVNTSFCSVVHEKIEYISTLGIVRWTTGIL